MEIIPESYRQGYYRTPITGERECVRGNECKWMGSPMVEFLTPLELSEKVRTGRYPQTRKMCIRCNDLATRVDPDESIEILNWQISNVDLKEYNDPDLCTMCDSSRGRLTCRTCNGRYCYLCDRSCCG
jgi:hypothetical protein